MRLLTAASDLDLSAWIRGLLSAGISGGASAVSGGTIVSMLAPETFNIQNGKFYVLVCGLFLSNAVVSIMKFLSSHPLPDEKIVKTVEVKAQAGAPPVVTTTVETTTTGTKQ